MRLEYWQEQTLKHGSACHLEAYDLEGDGEVLVNSKYECYRLILNL